MVSIQPEFSCLLRFFLPQKLTNQRQLFRILTNRRGVFLRKKRSNEKTQPANHCFCLGNLLVTFVAEELFNF